ncbi:hypothetical protein [Leptospira adleri]|uniref:Uncharacterized protein n=1 Tax=Leptospira adleri TaxID=2023186 RepID=A0A2M9YPU4_9LEPT|nr:hypothetical protein [Leptospira adleri]PJZ53542.1 hypothetical protein CH380_10205 [Leptospira adleri]PJZ62205.1 hypothetical protein CH376_09025 [Leptospira adleri]
MFKDIFKEKKTTDVYPLIVPSEYFKTGAFPAPQHPLPDERLSLTWVLLADRSMSYVNPGMSEALRRSGFDLQIDSLRQLKERSTDLIATHEKRRDDGSLLWVAMMHDDGLGSSRLLLASQLNQLFPEGYGIALPERSCGMAFSSKLSVAEKDDVRGIVKKCFESSRMSPILPDLLEPDAITIPSEWTRPHCT